MPLARIAKNLCVASARKIPFNYSGKLAANRVSECTTDETLPLDSRQNRDYLLTILTRRAATSNSKSNNDETWP